jgi:hypothetical protein
LTSLGSGAGHSQWPHRAASAFRLRVREVTWQGGDKTLALKYVSLIAPMIASIQELKKRDDELEVENAALRRDFEVYKEAHP